MKVNWPIPLLVVSTLVSCASSQRSVGDGAFQKRRLRAGWHVDLGLRREEFHTERIARMEPLGTATLSGREVSPAEPFTSLIPLDPIRTEGVHLRVVPSDVMPLITNAREQATERPEPSPRNTSEDTLGRWNPWSVPAFAVALGTVAYAILGTSEIIMLLAVIATIVLASIAVRKGRTNEWRGKGFAIAALMIGALAGLITLIAVLAG